MSTPIMSLYEWLFDATPPFALLRARALIAQLGISATAAEYVALVTAWYYHNHFCDFAVYNEPKPDRADYQEGGSWQEILGVGERKFLAARDEVSVKVHKGGHKNPHLQDTEDTTTNLVLYYTTGERLTFYTPNLAKLCRLLSPFAGGSLMPNPANMGLSDNATNAGYLSNPTNEDLYSDAPNTTFVGFANSTNVGLPRDGANPTNSGYSSNPTNVGLHGNTTNSGLLRNGSRLENPDDNPLGKPTFAGLHSLKASKIDIKDNTDLTDLAKSGADPVLVLPASPQSLEEAIIAALRPEHVYLTPAKVIAQRALEQRITTAADVLHVFHYWCINAPAQYDPIGYAVSQLQKGLFTIPPAKRGSGSNSPPSRAHPASTAWSAALDTDGGASTSGDEGVETVKRGLLTTLTERGIAPRLLRLIEDAEWTSTQICMYGDPDSLLSLVTTIERELNLMGASLTVVVREGRPQ